MAFIHLSFVTCYPVQAVISLSTRPEAVLVHTVGNTKQGQCKAEQHQAEEYGVAFVVVGSIAREISPSVTMSVSLVRTTLCRISYVETTPPMVPMATM